MISPFYISSMIDTFLRDNNFSHTRCIFRNEASSLFPNSSISNQVENGLLSLEEILDEYIVLKEEKVKVDQERNLLMQEKNRIQILLRDIQGAHYNVIQRPPHPLNVADTTLLSGVSVLTNPVAVMQNTYSTPFLVKNNVNVQNFPAHVISHVSDKKRKDNVLDEKRKDNNTVNGPPVAKKPRGRPPSKKKQVQDQNTEAQSSKAGSSCPLKQMVQQESIHSIVPIEVDKECKKEDVRSGLNCDAYNIPKSLDQWSKEDSFLTPESEKEDDLSNIDFPNFDDLFSGGILSLDEIGI